MKLVRESPDKLLVDWKPLKIAHLEKVLSERNSFAACALGNKIYIYGGISMKEQGPCTLGDLLEIDVQKLTARTIEQKGEKPPALNSATLVSCSKEAKLVLFGGANDELQAALHLYFFDIRTLRGTQSMKPGPSETSNCRSTSPESGSILATIRKSCCGPFRGYHRVPARTVTPKRLLG